jgi:uncharacterized membrane protein
MPGLSEIILLVAVVAALWYGMRWQRSVLAERKERVRARRKSQAEPNKGVEEMVECPRCGVYYAAGMPHQCDAAG